jgi:hypothetical protein
LIGEKPVNKFVYAIFGDFSDKKRVSLFTRCEIVGMAVEEAFSEGTTLEEFAGIPYVEDAEGNFHPTRELEGEELFDVAVDKLNSGGRVFLVFGTDAKGVKDFLGWAWVFNIEQSARLLLEQN